MKKPDPQRAKLAALTQKWRDIRGPLVLDIYDRHRPLINRS